LYRGEFREGDYSFGVQEEMHSPDIKPFYLGFVAFSGSGQIDWEKPQTRIAYRIYPDDQEARILDLIVQPQYQGKHIAKKLVEIAERRFREHGVTRVMGYAAPDFGGFWKKQGYRILPNNDILKEPL